jgi:hypothetical protein
MPGFLVHLGAQVQCLHGGQAETIVPIPTVTVSGQPVVAIDSPYVIAGCTFPPPPGANGPCVTGTFITASLQVTAFGQPLLLSDSMSICETSGTPMLILVTQTFASAI